MVGRRSGSRRKLVWATFDTSISLGVGPTFNNVDLLSNLRVAGSSVLGCTVIRVRGTVYVDNTGRAVTAALRWGMIVEDLENVGGVVNLADNFGRDWALWVSNRPVTAYGAAGQERQEVDLRAKRKVQELDQSFLFAATNTVGAATTIRPALRVLVALP